MPQDKNKIVVKIPVQKVVAVPQKSKMALGFNFSKLQSMLQLVADENAPHFVAAQQPLADNRAFAAKDGSGYYRPQVRVAQRTSGGPDVRFMKDAENKVWLQFELEEAPPAGLPANAKPLNIRAHGLTIKWVEGSEPKQLVLPQPTLISEPQPEAGKSHFYIRTGVQLSSTEVESVYHALSTAACQAKLELRLSYGYWLDSGATPSRPTIANPRIITNLNRIKPLVAARTARITSNPNGGSNRTAVASRAAAVTPLSRTNTVLNKNSLKLDLRKIKDKTNLVVNKDLLKHDLRKLKDQTEELKKNENYKTVNLTRVVSFYFAPELDQNHPIYSGITENEGLIAAWTDTGFGMVCKSMFPNTIYRLPDEIRLAYSDDIGAPYMLPALYRDDQEEVRVRVTLRAVPWHNPEQLVRLQDYLYRSSAGALAAPQIVVGGYEEAVLKLTTAFPEEITVLSGDGIRISLENGFELTLDLSLEYYRFLCELMAGRGGASPVGLTGEVAVTFSVASASGGEAPQKLTRRTPVRLNLDDLGGLPIDLEVDPETLSPKTVRVVNRSQSDLRIGDCMPRLLQYDANSVAPIEVFEAVAETAFPLELPKAGVLDIQIKPKQANEELLWNAVQMELIGGGFSQTPQEVLDKIHEIAPSGTLDWKINVECPVFLREPLPEQYNNLYRVEVQISRPGYTVQQIVLGKGQANGQVNMERRLKEILGESGGEIATFTYRVRNIYYDHQGAWSEAKNGEGSNIFIFPNPVDND
jgi:hypothetical protein